MIVRLSGHVMDAEPRAVLRAIRAEAIATPRPLRAWYGLLGVLILVGAVGAIRALFPGDKGIGTTPTVEWGLLIVGYVFFAITTSGLCLASSLGTVFGIDRFRPLEKRHALLAVLCLVTAFGVIALDLHYPVRLVFGAAFNPSLSSPMWWMGVFYGIYLCFLLTEVWSIFWHHERIHSFACLLSSGMAIIAPTTLGAVFGVLAARPFWTGAFTPIQMVAIALLSGTALLGIVFCVVDRLRLTGYERVGALAIPAIRSVLLIALVVVAVLLVRQVAAGLLTNDPGMLAATNALISGPLALEFIGIRVCVGLVLPLVILVLPWTRGPSGVLWAGCLAIVGVFADRLSFVSAGQIAPTTVTAGVASSPYASYTPSLVEISILVGAAAFIALLYTLAERYLDLRESETHIGFPLLLKLGGRLNERSRMAALAVAAAESRPGPVPVVAPDEPASAESADAAAEPADTEVHETEPGTSAPDAIAPVQPETGAVEPDVGQAVPLADEDSASPAIEAGEPLDQVPPVAGPEIDPVEAVPAGLPASHVGGDADEAIPKDPLESVDDADRDDPR